MLRLLCCCVADNATPLRAAVVLQDVGKDDASGLQHVRLQLWPADIPRQIPHVHASPAAWSRKWSGV